MTDTRDLATVRTEVRSILERTPAFRAMAAPDQKALANAMVRVGTFLSKDPAWLEQPALAMAQADGKSNGKSSGKGGQGAEPEKDPIGDLKQRMADKPKLVGQEFKAGAVREGVEQFGELVKKVDFPNVVSGLVNGVFQAVVKASMDQMKAYAELLSACAKTVDEFAQDNITDGAARDHIRSRFPSVVRVDTSGDTARLRPANDDANTAQLAQTYNISAVDLDDDDSEAALVAAAKVQLAQQRMQLMATMVLLGINRIVVTNGQINAKVVFDLRADDSAKRESTAALHDEDKSSAFRAEHNFSPMPWNVNANLSGSSQSHIATVESAMD